MTTQQHDLPKRTEERFAELRATAEPRLREQLVLDHQPIAVRCASRFRGRGEPLDDLIQVASLALVGAVDRFDPARGTPFVPYAIRCILGELRRHFRDHAWRLSVARRNRDLSVRFEGAIALLSQQLARPPLPREIADHLGVSVDHVVEALAAGEASRPQSLSAYRQGGRSIDDLVGAADPELSRVDDRLVVERATSQLDPRCRHIVQWRYYEGCTQAEIGRRLGLGQVQVSRLLRDSLGELRRVLSLRTGRGAMPTW